MALLLFMLQLQEVIQGCNPSNFFILDPYSSQRGSMVNKGDDSGFYRSGWVYGNLV
ncbi:unnamed protein product [Dovyalis caffra]|uniref:Uncharacterized protein n=1 Tax=Dovyalis caffra TaxID=77055 RepID=A0AAV1QQ74_9ROSI|nr:unnamed protein product [Dovyalis caffra]